VCGELYEKPDTAGCPFHTGTICSLCCTLEKSCGDMCKLSRRGEAELPAEAVGASLPMVRA
jgi:hypothetical protein